MNDFKSTLKGPPYSTACPFCQEQVTFIYTNQQTYKYYCDNHLPLKVEWFSIRNDQTAKEWHFKFMIYLPEHFMLHWKSQEDYFKIVEWKKSDSTYNEDGNFGYWDLGSLTDKQFDPDWIFSQTPSKILSIFELYKTFS